MGISFIKMVLLLKLTTIDYYFLITQWRHGVFKKNKNIMLEINKSVMLHAFKIKQRYRFTVFDKNTN